MAADLKEVEAETTYGQRTLAAATLALERLAAAIAVNHANQAIDRASDPDPPDEDRKG